MRRALVLLNHQSGALAASAAGDETERIRQALESRGIEVEIRALDGPDLNSAAEGAARAGFDAVIAGGGDGTLSCIANVLAGSAIPFGVLPLGTHNHFAKDLGMPLELDAAAAALAEGVAKNIDVGEVNGRIFLNFSGIGLHPHVVTRRDAGESAVEGARIFGRLLGKVMKVFAGCIALAQTLTDLPLLRVVLSGGGRTIQRITPSLIVCNNAYQMRAFGVENVSRPNRAILNVFIARATGPAGLIRLLIASLLRRLDTADVHDFESLALPALRISMRRRHLQISIDGEVVDMDSPLQYRVRAGGLKVIVPRSNCKVAPS